ncbi:MAG: hypothetical protein KDJ97_08610 [Anaerolineae bacterium]|nr:hypothetical protein [Anaerolineae bacterium]
MNSKSQLKQWLMIGLMLLALGLALGTASLAQAGNSLPERTPPTPTKERNEDHSGPAGAAIELVAPGHPGAWSVVQWQDINGDWQDVDGWQGSLDQSGQRRWWVAAKDFGTGPFRWVVGDTAAPTAASEPFHLPAVGAATLVVTLPAQ